jgi:hypothetical protein
VRELTVETFAAHLNQRFTVIHGASSLELTLVEAAARSGGRGQGRQPFALLFQGPIAPVLPQATYRFEHAELPVLDIFIVPVGPEQGRMRYEAIFS